MKSQAKFVVAGWVGIVAAAAFLALAGGNAADPKTGTQPIPPSKLDLEPLMNNPTFDKSLAPTGHSIPTSEARLEYATFGAGCFWGVEEVFRQTPGVVATAVGFAGGRITNPSYKDVCNFETGHAEVVHLQFDPTKVTYEQLLEVFWANHNPTTLNRQGPDAGTQYRSVIFCHGEAQRAAAEKSKQEQQTRGKWATRTIVTFIEPASPFYKADEDHQQYLFKRGLSNCHVP